MVSVAIFLEFYFFYQNSKQKHSSAQYKGYEKVEKITNEIGVVNEVDSDNA